MPKQTKRTAQSTKRAPSARQANKNPVPGRKKKKKRRIHLGRLAILCIPFLVLVVIGAIWFAVNKLNPLHLKSDVYVAEYMEEMQPLDNLKSLFMDSTSKITVRGSANIEKIGDYDMVYVYNGREYPFTVSVKDTRGPDVVLKDYKTDTTETVKAENFIDSITDASMYSYKMDNSADTKEPGSYTIVFTAKDQYGNETTKNAKLTRVMDKEAPVLENFEDAITIEQGDEYPSKDYTIVDNADSNPSLHVDTSKLDVTTPGDYTVAYTVRDRSGNEKVYDQKVTVEENPDYGKPIVYLTFDDGPSENTEKILDILDEYDAKATFFVIGANPDEYPIMKEIAKRGQTIGLHTMSHDYAKIYASEEAYFDDLKQISDVVENQTGIVADCIRFPGGSSNTVSQGYNEGIMTRLTQEVQDRGYQYFDWNADSTDASGNNVSVDQIVANATAGIGQDKVNILFHDAASKETTVEALPRIIQAYKDAGYAFKGVSKNSFAPHHTPNN